MFGKKSRARIIPERWEFYTYTFSEIRDNWDHFMRGLKIPYPSPEYVKDRSLDLSEGVASVTLSNKTDGDLVLADAIRWSPSVDE